MDLFSITSPFVQKACDAVSCYTMITSIIINERDLIIGSIFFLLGIITPLFIWRIESKKAKLQSSDIVK